MRRRSYPIKDKNINKDTFDFNIRRVMRPEPKVIAEVRGLEEAAFGSGGLNEWHLPYIIRHGHLYVLEIGMRIDGAASLIRSWDTKKVYLVDLVVREETRKHGLGRLLMKKLISDLSREGIEHVELTVAEENEAAIKLYQRIGFRKVDFYKDEYGQGHDRWLLRVDIQATKV